MKVNHEALWCRITDVHTELTKIKTASDGSHERLVWCREQLELIRDLIQPEKD